MPSTTRASTPPFEHSHDAEMNQSAPLGSSHSVTNRMIPVPACNVSNIVMQREIGGTARLLKLANTAANTFNEVAANRVPHTLRRPVIEYAGMNLCDKIFSGCWIDSDTIAMGTKDNQLIIWQYLSNNFTSLDLPPSHTPQPYDNCGIHSVGINSAATLLFSGGSNPLDIQLFSLPSFTPNILLRGHNDWVFSAKFISDDVLVSASRDSTVIVWNVGDDCMHDVEDEEPYMEEDTLEEFCSDLEADHEQDVSYDPSVEPQTYDAIDSEHQDSVLSARSSVRRPTAVRREHTNRVRDLQYNSWARQFYTLSQDLTVKVWDCSNFDVLCTIPLKEDRDLVCMATHDRAHLLAVGSNRYINILDTRCANHQADAHTHSVVSSVPSRLDEFGVRSLQFNNHVLSIGSARGSLSFYDLRASRFLRVGDEDNSKLKRAVRRAIHQEQGPEEFRSGDGWVNRDSNFYSIAGTMSINHAIYTQCYDPSRTKLFVAGGPILSGIKGSYAAVW